MINFGDRAYILIGSDIFVYRAEYIHTTARLLKRMCAITAISSYYYPLVVLEKGRQLKFPPGVRRQDVDNQQADNINLSHQNATSTLPLHTNKGNR
jgi:hypothetical protein